MKKGLAWLAALTLLGLWLGGCGREAQIWRNYGGDGGRTLTARGRGPNKPRLLWVTDLEGINPGSPVVDEKEKIYVPHSGGSLTQVDKDGTVQWRFDSWVSGSSTLPPYLLVQPGGKILMSTQPPHEETFQLSRRGETILGVGWLPWPAAVSPVSTSSGYTVACHQYVTETGLIALRVFGTVKGGEALWRRDFYAPDRSFFASNPAVLEDGRSFVFVETDVGDNFLLAMDGAGQVLWRAEFLREETRGVGAAIAVAPDGTVYFGTPRIEDIARVYTPGWLYAVKEGQVLWRAEAGQHIEQIMVAPGLVVANVLRTKLLALDPGGKELWQHRLEGWESNGVMDSRGCIYMAGVKNGTVQIKAIDARGRERWTFDTRQRAEAVSYLVLVNKRLYLASADGKLMAISD
ncbi:MAG: PQQ-binding-like beta-propeller repeat protein [Firmicutes bacterium]|nr:PQQ-binding-like beta-propeller repeat protein [Bacillota bacterium]HOB34194.1 PQQ-binding-like beta-propeller repeat protein [Bacillota bacterium]HPZ90188.1 PQQ-binding-like beta-propeller repeat protein [Bacillota bacterium]HQE01578.1 PQQ-binding-like beta-propeller repeat protein [Bacillota bacterium]